MNKVAGYCGGEGRAPKYRKRQWNAAIRAKGRLTGKGGFACVGREANENKV